MRIGLVSVLCVISAAVGAGLDRYITEVASSPQAQSPETVQTTASAPSERSKEAEVLGDRVRCDVRFGELRLPDSAYRSFFDHCMGNSGG